MQVWFQIADIDVSHSRSVSTFMDFLGQISGINELLMMVSIFTLGVYSNTFSQMQIMNTLYKYDLNTSTKEVLKIIFGLSPKFKEGR